MNRKLQVFISSTYTDLREERQAAVEAVLKSGNIPAGMELFTAGSLSQMDVIKRWIDESDVYMLILGGRYGSIESSTKLSYTELEYEYAREQGKPIFAVVIEEAALNEKIKKEGAAIIEQNHPHLLKQFRDKVLQNMCAFFSEIKDIKLAVHESMSDFKTDPKLRGWVSGDQIGEFGRLNDDIKRLSEENADLLKRLERQQAPTTISSNADAPNDHSTLQKALGLIEVVVPAAAATDGEEFTTDLLNAAYQKKELLTSGITYHKELSPVLSFLYWNILPRLEIHDLANTEIADTGRRRILTKKGRELFADYEIKTVISSATKVKSKKTAAKSQAPEGAV